MADDRGHLHCTDICQFRCHDAFGDVTCHLGRRAIDLVGDGHRCTVFVFFRHLGFAVRIDALHDPLLTHRGQTPSELMREPDVGDFLGRRCVLEEHGTGEITTWLIRSSQVFSLL
jgi:hypothetical protein